MKILQVVAHIDSYASYGGPGVVATNQAKALANQGHDVTLISTSVPDEVGQCEHPGIHATGRVTGIRFRSCRIGKNVRSGFAAILAPEMLRWAWRNLPEYDLVHVHMARDALTTPIAILGVIRRTRIVIQTHGMIRADGRLVTKAYDRILTARVSRNATKFIALDNQEKRQLEFELGVKSDDISILPNGISVPNDEFTPEPRRETTVRVLFLARLNPRKRAPLFIEAAKLVARQSPVHFELVGEDQGDGDLVRAMIKHYRADVNVSWSGPATREMAWKKLQSCDVYVLPSVNEPFPMSVLEAMVVGKPVIVSKSCGLADLVESQHAGYVVRDDDVKHLSESMQRLIDDEDLRSIMGVNAQRAVHQRYSMAAIGTKLENVYAKCAEIDRGRGNYA